MIPAAARDVVTFGETMLAVHVTGPLGIGASARLDVAGSESNVAVGLARLGHRVRWVSRLGDDEPGRLVRKALEAERVDVCADSVAGAETGIITFDRGPWGAARVSYRRDGSAASALDEQDLDRLFDQPARMLHVTGITAGLGPAGATAVTTALSRAHAAGWSTSLDVNHRSRLWSAHDARAVLAPLLVHVDVLVASEDELGIVALGSSTSQRVRNALDWVRLVAVKKGGQGASLHNATDQWDQSAIPVPIVSTVGAGDAFTAGLLSGLLDDLEPGAALRRGALLGAAAVASASDWQGLPTRRELTAITEGSWVSGEVQR